MNKQLYEGGDYFTAIFNDLSAHEARINNLGLDGYFTAKVRFNDHSPADLNLFIPQGMMIQCAIVLVTEAWNGTGAKVDVGIDGDNSLFDGSTIANYATLAPYANTACPVKSSGGDVKAVIVKGTGASTGGAEIIIGYGGV